MRKNYLTQTIPISAAQHLFLQNLHEGQTIDASLSSLATHTGTPREQVRAAWETQGGTRDVWIKAGMFVVA
ncbi:MAG: hypothetical protein P8Q26_00830 [Ascidiaceihabitans sp.]|nr:hypothetical protein [Ascidiaceihabitans sp.]